MSCQRACPVVGLVGGIGSGKSAIARRTAERFGFVLIDGDAAGHAALADPIVRTELAQQFGDSIFVADGSVDRRSLAARVFGSSEDHSAAKVSLERIVHPLIEDAFRKGIAAARRDCAPAVLLDAAVLFEAGWQQYCDVVVFVDASSDVRRSRIAGRGWSEDEWRRRESSQLSLEVKRRRAHRTIENTASIDEAVDALVATIGEFCGGSFRETGVVSVSTA